MRTGPRSSPRVRIVRTSKCTRSEWTQRSTRFACASARWKTHWKSPKCAAASSCPTSRSRCGAYSSAWKPNSTSAKRSTRTARSTIFKRRVRWLNSNRSTPKAGLWPVSIRAKSTWWAHWEKWSCSARIEEDDGWNDSTARCDEYGLNRWDWKDTISRVSCHAIFDLMSHNDSKNSIYFC